MDLSSNTASIMPTTEDVAEKKILRKQRPASARAAGRRVAGGTDGMTPIPERRKIRPKSARARVGASGLKLGSTGVTNAMGGTNGAGMGMLKKKTKARPSSAGSKRWEQPKSEKDKLDALCKAILPQVSHTLA